MWEVYIFARSWKKGEMPVSCTYPKNEFLRTNKVFFSIEESGVSIKLRSKIQFIEKRKTLIFFRIWL